MTYCGAFDWAHLQALSVDSRQAAAACFCLDQFKADAASCAWPAHGPAATKGSFDFPGRTCASASTSFKAAPATTGLPACGVACMHAGTRWTGPGCAASSLMAAALRRSCCCWRRGCRWQVRRGGRGRGLCPGRQARARYNASGAHADMRALALRLCLRLRWRSCKHIERRALLWAARPAAHRTYMLAWAPLRRCAQKAPGQGPHHEAATHQPAHGRLPPPLGAGLPEPLSTRVAAEGLEVVAHELVLDYAVISYDTILRVRPVQRSCTLCAAGMRRGRG